MIRSLVAVIRFWIVCHLNFISIKNWTLVLESCGILFVKACSSQFTPAMRSALTALKHSEMFWSCKTHWLFLLIWSKSKINEIHSLIFRCRCMHSYLRTNSDWLGLCLINSHLTKRFNQWMMMMMMFMSR